MMALSTKCDVTQAPQGSSGYEQGGEGASSRLRRVVLESPSPSPLPKELMGGAIPLSDGASMPQEYGQTERVKEGGKYTRRTTLSGEEAPEHEESEEGTAIQDGMVVSMLVPEKAGNSRTGEDSQQTQSSTSLSQVFVMVFMAQSAKYVTYSCQLPVIQM